MSCPLCRSTRFYIKNDEDEYETHEFELCQGQIRFDDEEHMEEAPDVTQECEIFCQRCAWHGPLNKLKSTS